jgi:hypothetical protein
LRILHFYGHAVLGFAVDASSAGVNERLDGVGFRRLLPAPKGQVARDAYTYL